MTDMRDTLAALDRLAEQMKRPAPAQQEQAEPATPHEWLARELHAAQSPWHTLGGSDDEAA